MTYETPLKITAWHVETDKFRIRRLGKALEELGELTSVLARCIIQGVDETDSSSGEVNRMRMQKETADVLTQLSGLAVAFSLDNEAIHERVQDKQDSMDKWEELLREEQVPILQGLYDNRETYQRENYHRGSLLSRVGAGLVGNLNYLLGEEWDAPWGTYPDIPRDCMNVGELKALIEHLPDDTPVVDVLGM